MANSEIVNFGKNVRFTPAHFYAPRTERELLDILERHKCDQVRVVASRHAWSNSIKSDDALIDMRHFNKLHLSECADETFATVGGGCQIKHLLAMLNNKGLTTPSVGLITEQTIAGAISTGTHGSGKHSLSHYISSLRIACFSVDGDLAIIREINDGAELRAARCSLGCLGVIVDVTFRCIPQYYVSERSTPCDSIEDVMEREKVSPLQQFFLIPHLWRFYAQERRVADRNKASLTAPLYRLYWFLNIDLGLHVLIKLFAATFQSKSLVHFLFRQLLPLMVFPRWEVTDRSDRMLVMEHELFRHLEMEIFVPATQVRDAANYVAEVLQIADGSRTQLSESFEARLQPLGLLAALDSIHGIYCQHYAICFRRVLADDTLISMSSGKQESWYSISFITYVEPRDPFYDLADFLATSMARLFLARLHWGKWFPLEEKNVVQMYPDLKEFQDVCSQFDPRGVFRNDFVNTVLGRPALPGGDEETQHVVG